MTLFDLAYASNGTLTIDLTRVPDDILDAFIVRHNAEMERRKNEQAKK